MLEGIGETAGWTLGKIEAIRNLMEAARQYFRDQRPRIYRPELLDLIFEWPYIRIANVVNSGLAERQTASRYLNELTQIGILEERPMGREKLFLNTRLLRLLTAESNEFKPLP